jgi:protoheme IX farnesyltransferase
MKTAASLAPPLLADAPPVAPLFSGITARIPAFVELTKPRIAVLALLTVAVGFFLGARGASQPAVLGFTLFGTALVAAGASAWNQYLERVRDARMKRTATRPLPTGRVAPREAAIFGTILTVCGVAVLAAGPHPLAAGVALVTFILYAFVYTPLKPVTTLNTAIGAVPGALPPVIGWAAATGQLGVEAWALFLIVFLWQFPHFLAIAWIYRDDYERGGHRMLPIVDPGGSLTGRQATVHALALIPVGLLPAAIGLAGGLYFLGALTVGVIYVAAATRFWVKVSDASARRLLRSSFVYLLAILLLLLLNPMPV